MLVNFQPKSMPGAMKESDPSASAHLSRKTPFSEKFLDRLVNRHPINSCLDSLQRQRFAVPAQSFSGTRLGRFQNFDRALESFFRDSQGLAHHFDFLLRFRLALRPEKSVCRADTYLVCDEFLRVSNPKICRNNY